MLVVSFPLRCVCLVGLLLVAAVSCGVGIIQDFCHLIAL